MCLKENNSFCFIFPPQRQEMPTLDDDSGSDREDELPQIVVIKDGDLTTDEVKNLKEEKRASDATEKGKPG